MITVCPCSYSLEGLTGGQVELRGPNTQGPRILEPSCMPRHDSDDRGSLVSLTEEQEEIEEHSRLHDPVRSHTQLSSHTKTSRAQFTREEKCICLYINKTLKSLETFQCGNKYELISITFLRRPCSLLIELKQIVSITSEKSFVQLPF